METGDLDRSRKTMIAMVFYLNLMAFIVSFFYYSIAFYMVCANVLFLGVQYAMDKTEHKVAPYKEMYDNAKKDG